MVSSRIGVRFVLCAAVCVSAAGRSFGQNQLFEPVSELGDIPPERQKILDRIDRSMGTVAGTRKIVRLNANFAAAAANADFAVDLPHGYKVPFKSRVVERNVAGVASAANIAGRGEKITETVQLSIADSSATGLIYTADKVFAVEPIGGGLQAITELDQSKFDMHGHGADFEKIEKRPINPQLLQGLAAAAAPVEITVLVCYTPKVESLQANVQSLINSAVALTNTSYTNSKVNIRLKLVGTRKVNYAESASHSQDLANFTGKNDGKMDDVHNLRNQLKADVCVLLINNDSQCGQAAAILANANTAFCVVHHDCAVKNLSFAHEIGHLQGARHNRAADPTIDPSRPYNHGYLSPGNLPWRTIMAYPAAGKPNRLPYWSNPNVLMNGVPMGTAGFENNARMLNESAKTVSLFR